MFQLDFSDTLIGALFKEAIGRPASETLLSDWARSSDEVKQVFWNSLLKQIDLKA